MTTDSLLCRQDWLPYFQYIAGHLGLSHWKLDVSDNPPDFKRPADATVVAWDMKFRATISLSDEFLKQSSDQQAELVVHELLHCHFAHHDALLEEYIPSHATLALDHAQERAICGLAAAIAPLLPSPEEFFKSKQRAARKREKRASRISKETGL
jgi:hypothetical protein